MVVNYAGGWEWSGVGCCCFPGGSVVKNLLPMLETPVGSLGSEAGKIPWRREWQPSPVFLPGKSHGEGSLKGYSPCG